MRAVHLQSWRCCLNKVDYGQRGVDLLLPRRALPSSPAIDRAGKVDGQERPGSEGQGYPEAPGTKLHAFPHTQGIGRGRTSVRKVGRGYPVTGSMIGGADIPVRDCRGGACPLPLIWCKVTLRPPREATRASPTSSPRWWDGNSCLLASGQSVAVRAEQAPPLRDILRPPQRTRNDSCRRHLLQRTPRAAGERGKGEEEQTRVSGRLVSHRRHCERSAAISYCAQGDCFVVRRSGLLAMTTEVNSRL